jgi:hypothetical protein
VLYGAWRTAHEFAETGVGAGGRPVSGVIKWMRDWLNDFF